MCQVPCSVWVKDREPRRARSLPSPSWSALGFACSRRGRTRPRGSGLSRPEGSPGLHVAAGPLGRMPAILGGKAQCGPGEQGSGGEGSPLWRCGFTSLSLTRRGICFFSVRFVTSHLSPGEMSSLASPPQPWPSLQCSSSVESLPPTTHDPGAPTAPLRSRKGGGVESGNLCGDTSSVGPLVSRAPPGASLGPTLPPASPPTVRVPGAATGLCMPASQSCAHPRPP